MLMCPRTKIPPSALGSIQITTCRTLRFASRLLPNPLCLQFHLAAPHFPATIKLASHPQFLLRNPFPQRNHSLTQAEDNHNPNRDTNHISSHCTFPNTASILRSAIGQLDFVLRRWVEETVDVEMLCGVSQVC